MWIMAAGVVMILALVLALAVGLGGFMPIPLLAAGVVLLVWKTRIRPERRPAERYHAHPLNVPS